MDAERLEPELGRFEGLGPDEGRQLADELGVALRLLEPDAMYTMEFRSDRVTADLVDGRITAPRIQ
jgi:hypothetical protein